MTRKTKASKAVWKLVKEDNESMVKSDRKIRASEANNMQPNIDESRSIFVFEEFTDKLAKESIEKLVRFETVHPEKEIKVFINSPGGFVLSLFSIIDAMNLVAPNIVTYCIGEAASCAAILLLCGTKGKRYITKNSRVLLHQVSSGAYGHITDVKISIKESDRVNKQLLNMILANTKIKKNQLKKLVERDCWLTAKDALKYGVVDKII